MRIRSERRQVSLAYFLYFATLGLYLPYFPAYLRARGLGGAEIGLLLAIGPLLRGFVPPAVGMLADRVRGPKFWNMVTAWGMAAGVLVLVGGGDFWFLALGVVLYSFGSAATIPLLDAATLSHLQRTPGRYGHIRLWGSVGFILSSFGLGQIFPTLPAMAIALSLLGAHLIFAGFITGSQLEEAPPDKPGWREIGPLIRTGSMLLLLMVLLLNRVASASYVGFYTLYVQDVGLAGDVVAWTWGIAVLVEVAIMLYVDRLIDRFGPKRVMIFGLVLEALRWFAYAALESKTALLVLAPGHGISFATIYVATIRILMHTVPERLRATGQGLAAGATGLGHTFGMILAGILQQTLGHATMWTVAGVAGLSAALLAARLPGKLRG